MSDKWWGVESAQVGSVDCFILCLWHSLLTELSLLMDTPHIISRTSLIYVPELANSITHEVNACNARWMAETGMQTALNPTPEVLP